MINSNPIRFLFSLILIFLVTSLFAQPGDYYQTYLQEADTIWNKNEIILVINSKDTIEISDFKNGMKSGEQNLFNLDGSLKSIAHFKNDLLNGKKEVFLSDGTFIEKYKYKKGKKHGKYKAYHRNGNLKEEGRFKNDLLIGNRKTYDNQGELVRDENFAIHKNEEGIPTSVMEGRNRYYYNNGNISQDLHYKNGKKDGLNKEYHPDKENSLKSEVEFKNGLRHGSFAYYSSYGFLERTGTFYQEIKLKDTVLRNVYDGEFVVYQGDGVKQKVENWENYKRNGPFETYYYRTGELSTRVFYKDNIKVGVEKRWDKAGSQTYEAHFEANEVDGQPVSQQIGLEKTWQDGILKTVSEWENNLKNGEHIAYFPNGNPEQIMNFKEGVLDGSYQIFYESGRIKYDYTYRAKNKNYNYIGWNYAYDENGSLNRRFLAKGDGNNIIEEVFEKGEKRSFTVNDIFNLRFSPNNSLASLKWLNWNSINIYGYEFFGNHTPRKVYFKVKGDFSTQSASLTQNGEVFQIRTNTGRNIEGERKSDLGKLAKTIAENYNPDWFQEDLVTQTEINGKHQWNYADGKPFFQIEFQNDLPQGNWLVYDAVSQDTLIQAEFDQGIPVGNWVKKNSSGMLMSRKNYFSNHNVKEFYNYNENGILIKKGINDSLGNREVLTEYYADGALKHRNNNLNKTWFHLDANGDTLSSNLLYVKQDSIRVVKSFYSGNRLRNLKRKNLTNGTGISKTYFENGQMRTFHEMKDDKSDGIYELYDETGKLLTKGKFKNGKRHGEWINFLEEGKQILQYEEGEIILKPDDTKNCQCYDRSLASDKIGFAQSMEYFSPYKKTSLYFPDYLVPFEGFNYDKIFFIGLQTSNSYSGGYTRMKLLPYKEFSFYVPVAKYVKVNLNPCRTEGYLSNLEASFNYNYAIKKLTHASIEPKRIAVSLENNPLFDSENNSPFIGYFDTNSISFQEDKMEVYYANDRNACFTQGKINDFLKVEVLQAEARIEPRLQNWYPQTEDFPLMKNEIDRFFGFEITEANLKFTFPKNDKPIEVKATSSKIFAGANFVAAEIQIHGRMKEEGGFTLKDTDETIEISKLKRFLEQQDFYRIKIDFSVEAEALNVQFYTEK